MNTSKLKTFAPEVRRRLMEAVGRKLDFVLAGETADLRAKAKKREGLARKAKADRQDLVERVAYTWFNRLAALRFLDARGWHPFRARVLTAATPEETQPELLKLVRTGALPAELAPFTDPDRLNDWLDRRLPSPDPQGEVYRHLVLAACRFYHDLMPFLFEELDDETELLLPDDLLTSHSIAQGFRTKISDEDCAEVELLGWLYQFYISEKKDQVMARKGAVPTEDIPAVTQLFTPHWIVRYLVENSLGRLWLHSRPQSHLKEHMPYYVADPGGESPPDSLMVERPEEIKINDPACGSGHMLTYAFDLLYRIYEEEGYAPGEIPGKILTHNLYGIEICPRAGQLAQFALVCKAREYDRSFFRNPIQPHICVLENIHFEDDELQRYMDEIGRDLFTTNLQATLYQFEEADTFGSLICPAVTDVGEVMQLLKGKGVEKDLFLIKTHKKVLKALKQAHYLNFKYHVVVANPPYLGGRGMNSEVKEYLKEHYKPYKSDLFSVFIYRGSIFSLNNGYLGYMSPNVWMYISSHRELRKHLIEEQTILSLVELPLSGFSGATVQICAFVFQNRVCLNYPGGFIRLCGFKGPNQMASKTLEAVKNPDCGWFFRASAEDFNKIPGSPIAYWLSKEILHIFEKGTALKAIGDTRQGMATSDNNRFLKIWPEVSFYKICFNAKSRIDAKESGKKWFPYNKGGEFKKWYGNSDYLVNWENDGQELLEYAASLYGSPTRTIKSISEYFKPCISWSKISSSNLAMRYYPDGYIFDVAGCSIFSKDKQDLLYLLGYANTLMTRLFLASTSPTLNFEAGQVAQLPILTSRNISHYGVIEKLINKAKLDWDSYETSWDFTSLPLLHPDYRQPTLKATYTQLRTHWREMTLEMQRLEEENNRIFIEAYGLQDELTPEVPLNEITLTCNPYYRYGGNKSEAELEKRLQTDTMKELLSYAMGCMMGRYSLDKPGLILANAGDTLDNYLTKLGKSIEDLCFIPDEDGIIPILDGEWFEDDIVARTRDFLRVTFSEDTLEENIRFIEESLGKDLRKYFLTDFYKNHLQTYKKRPIYWLFQSPKKGFNTLIYLHRYTRDTVNGILNRYLREFLHKLRSRLEHLEHVSASEATPAREKGKANKEIEIIRKLLRECEEWERDVLLPLAQQRIEIDLDDGVKVNYLKFGSALAPIPGLKAKE